MNPQWSSGMAWCGTLILMGGFVALLASFGAPRVEKADARSIAYPAKAAIEDLPAAAHASDSKLSETLPTPRIDNIAVGNAGVKTSDTVGNAVVETPDPSVSVSSNSSSPVPAAAPEIVPTPDEPKPFAVASLDPSPRLPVETPAVPATTAPAVDLSPNELMVPVSRIEGPEDCVIADICIDQYLWALYQRTPKQDTNKVYELRKVTVKRKGKTKTVTRRLPTLVDGDFTWKDPHAAKKAGKPLMKYVIGGMDRTFRTRLLYMLLAAEEAGLSPGITSAFRDDYRQAIATGQKAASNRSYHGGSLRGGYGHGLAADVVGLKGTTRAQRWVSSDMLWKWIDENGKQFGIGRPYLHRDAPHVAPIDGQEYATHYRAPKVQQAKAGKTKRDQQAAQKDKSKARTASPVPDGTPKIVATGETDARRQQ